MRNPLLIINNQTSNLFDKEVLVTGGLGFIGSNLVHKLIEYGAKVTVYDALLESGGGNLANIKEIQDQVNVVIGDIREFSKLKDHVSNKSVIFHLAANTSHLLSMKDPHTDIDISCKGSINVLEACRRYNDDTKIVFTGTRTQTGEPVYLPVDEKHPDFPSDIYGVNKLAAEKYHLLYHKVYGIKTTSLRLTNTYGPRHQMKHGEFGIVNYFMRKAMLDETIEVYGDGQQIRDYNYVDDVCDALILAAQSDKSTGEIFLLGSGERVKFIDMVKLVIKTVGKGRYIMKPFPPVRKAIDVKEFVVNYDKINQMLGWKPKTSLKEGLKRTFKFYQERLYDYI